MQTLESNTAGFLRRLKASQGLEPGLRALGTASAADVMQALFISALLTAIAHVHAFEPNTGSQLLVQAGSCAAFEFTPQPQYKFTYTLKLLSVAAVGCDRGQIQCAPCCHGLPVRAQCAGPAGSVRACAVRVGGAPNPLALEALQLFQALLPHRLTKFYIREACLKQRDNELGLNSYNTLTCPAATDSASATCGAAFNLGVH